MALASALGRDWILEVKNDSDVWTKVKGLSSVSPVFAGAMQDDSDIDSKGFGSQISTGQAFSIPFSGKRKYESATDDPGQDILRRRGRRTGADNIVDARIYRRDALPDAYACECAIEFTDSAASDPNGLQEFSGTLWGRGEPEEIVKPAITDGDPATFLVTLGTPSAGNFTLTWNGHTTANIAYNAASSAVLSALAALDDGYVSADFTVTGSAGGPYTVTVPHGVLTGSGAGLTGGTFSVAAA